MTYTIASDKHLRRGDLAVLSGDFRPVRLQGRVVKILQVESSAARVRLLDAEPGEMARFWFPVRYLERVVEVEAEQ